MNDFSLWYWIVVIGLGTILGAVIGSFLSVVIRRVPAKKSIGGRSACPSCDQKLRWTDLIPVWSYIALKGKCRACAEPIAPWYLWVEIATAILFGFATWIGQPTDFTSWVFLVYSWIIIAGAIALGMTDLRDGLLPNKILLTLAAMSLPFWVYFVWVGSASFVQLVVGLGISGFLFAVLHLGSKGKAMGAGDVKYAALLGAWFAWPTITIVLYIAFILGLFIALGLLIAHRKKKTDTLPFGSILSLAAIVVALFHDPLRTLLSLWIGW